MYTHLLSILFYCRIDDVRGLANLERLFISFSVFMCVCVNVSICLSRERANNRGDSL